MDFDAIFAEGFILLARIETWITYVALLVVFLRIQRCRWRAVIRNPQRQLGHS